MMTSCAVPALHSSTALYNQTPWYLPRLQDNAVKGKQLLCGTAPMNITMRQALQYRQNRIGLFKTVISFRKAGKCMHSFHYVLQYH